MTDQTKDQADTLRALHGEQNPEMVKAKNPPAKPTATAKETGYSAAAMRAAKLHPLWRGIESGISKELDTQIEQYAQIIERETRDLGAVWGGRPFADFWMAEVDRLKARNAELVEALEKIRSSNISAHVDSIVNQALAREKP